MPGLNNLKAFWNAIHLHIPREFIYCRKLGSAGLSAPGAPKILNPTIAGHYIICAAIPKRSYVVAWCCPNSDTRDVKLGHKEMPGLGTQFPNGASEAGVFGLTLRKRQGDRNTGLARNNS